MRRRLRQREAPGGPTRHSGDRFKLRKSNSAGPQPQRPAGTPLSLPYRVRVRNTPAEQRGTWATFAKAARTGARMSQSELARRLNVERTTVWRWETGKQKPESADMVAAFARILDIDLDEALAAAGLRPGVTAPAEPTREVDEEIDLVRRNPNLTEQQKMQIVKVILARRERERVAAIEETRRMIEIFRRDVS